MAEITSLSYSTIALERSWLDAASGEASAGETIHRTAPTWSPPWSWVTQFEEFSCGGQKDGSKAATQATWCFTVSRGQYLWKICLTLLI